MSKEQTTTEQYIKAYQELLQEKGYEESGLHNNEPQGKLATCIREAFEQCSANREKAVVALIAISVPGLTPGDKEKFMLTFNFRFTPATGKFELDVMEADTKDFHIKISPMVIGGIPTLSALHEHFKEMKELKRIKQNKEQKKVNGKKRINGKGLR